MIVNLNHSQILLEWDVPKVTSCSQKIVGVTHMIHQQNFMYP